MDGKRFWSDRGGEIGLGASGSGPGEGPARSLMDESLDPLATFARDLFQNRTALVTGGGRGIGRAIALAFARLGADVVIASRKPENLEPTAEEIRGLGRACLAVPTNVREVGEVE